jgi:hypothetical protein
MLFLILWPTGVVCHFLPKGAHVTTFQVSCLCSLRRIQFRINIMIHDQNFLGMFKILTMSTFSISKDFLLCVSGGSHECYPGSHRILLFPVKKHCFWLRLGGERGWRAECICTKNTVAPKNAKLSNMLVEDRLAHFTCPVETGVPLVILNLAPLLTFAMRCRNLDSYFLNINNNEHERSLRENTFKEDTC